MLSKPVLNSPTNIGIVASVVGGLAAVILFVSLLMVGDAKRTAGDALALAQSVQTELRFLQARVETTESQLNRLTSMVERLADVSASAWQQLRYEQARLAQTVDAVRELITQLAAESYDTRTLWQQYNTLLQRINYITSWIDYLATRR
jgi:DNA anti-recombination protein RmuC